MYNLRSILNANCSGVLSKSSGLSHIEASANGWQMLQYDFLPGPPCQLSQIIMQKTDPCCHMP